MLRRIAPAAMAAAARRACGSRRGKKTGSWIACGTVVTLCAAFGNAQASSAVEGEVLHELPIDKLKWKRKVDGANRKPVVLVACGSFNPPTLMHLRMFEVARDALAKRGWDVVGGYVSPVNDSYEKKTLIPSKHRIDMCKLAVENSDMIMVDEWEAKQPAYVTTIRVLERVDEALNKGKAAQEPKTRVLFLCGADVIDTMAIPGVWADRDIEKIFSKEHGLVCITREEANIPELLEATPLLKRVGKDIIVVDEPVPNQISSSRLRAEVAHGHSIKYLTPDSVIQYIERQKLYKREVDRA